MHNIVLIVSQSEYLMLANDKDSYRSVDTRISITIYSIPQAIVEVGDCNIFTSKLKNISCYMLYIIPAPFERASNFGLKFTL